jgi:transcriptional regulator MraZ
MLSHIDPWASVCRTGGTLAALVGRPLPSARGESVGGKVELFLSTYVNKVDRKGRVSVPATFRASLGGQRFAGIVVFPSFIYKALEGSGIDRMEEMTARLDSLEQFSEDYDNLSLIFASAQQLPFDTEGRIVLPAELAAHAGIDNSAAFVGLGRSFQIWEPGRLDEHKAMLRQRARQQGTRLPPLGGRSPARPQ